MSSQLNNGVTPQYSLGALVADDISAVDLNRTNGWANAFGSRRYKNGGDGATLRHNLTGFMAGMDGQITSRMRLGGFFGTSNTYIETARDQQTTEIESIFGGLYASYATENITFKLGIAGGVTEHDSFRLVDNNQVSGLQKVSSSLRGSFIAPELLVSHESEWNTLKIQSTLRVGYTGLFLDGYSESGRDAALTTDNMNLHLVNARLEVAVLYSLKTLQGYDYKFSPYIGIEGRSIVKGSAVNTSLLGQSFKLDVSDKDNVASAFIGFRSSLQYTDDLNSFAQAEGLASSDDTTIVSGNIGFKWTF